MGCTMKKNNKKSRKDEKKMKFMFYYLMNLPQIKPRVAESKSEVVDDALSSINMQKMSTPTAAAHQPSKRTQN